MSFSTNFAVVARFFQFFYAHHYFATKMSLRVFFWSKFCPVKLCPGRQAEKSRLPRSLAWPCISILTQHALVTTTEDVRFSIPFRGLVQCTLINMASVKNLIVSQLLYDNVDQHRAYPSNQMQLSDLLYVKENKAGRGTQSVEKAKFPCSSIIGLLFPSFFIFLQS